MTDHPHGEVSRLFDKVRELPAAEREAVLHRECAGDEGLKRRILDMIEAEESDRALGDMTLEDMPVRSSVEASTAETPREQYGREIGRYRILEVLGEGGFGVVYRAEQSEPVRRQVALKVIKPGMDSKAVLSRFEAERQALALMDHPGVAKVLDGGTTDEGRPYFAMELVRGEPITQHCDKQKLGVRARVELFTRVCEAVQHAHHKGVVHRDLKPSNILVQYEGGKATPKVIDFGVAKALNQRLTEVTIFTGHGQMIGTPEYMSPEQAEMSGTDIDTRSDVYSLGVLLYELLTGQRPFDGPSLRAAAQIEMQRIIREVDPPKPSTRLSTAADADSVARSRGTEARTLSGVLRRDLDWVCMKCLEKDRERRYDTANALAEDLRRFLADQPVLAGPPSASYRLSKFVRRNRAGVIAASLVVAAVIAGLAGTSYGLIESLRQERLARQAATSEAEQRQIAEREAEEARLARERAESAEGEAQLRAEQLQKVSDFQSQMLAQIDTTKAGTELMVDVGERFAEALQKAGVPETERQARLDGLRQELVRVNATDTAATMIDRTILKPAIKAIDEQFKDQPVVDAQMRQTLAVLYQSIGLYNAAFPLQESALATRRHVLGEEHPDTLDSISNMGSLLLSQGKLDQAEPYYREALEKRRRVLGEEHPDTLSSINGMGFLLQAHGKLDLAEPYYREALEKRRRVLGEAHPETINCIFNLGRLLQAQGKLDLAEPYFREALEIRRRVLGEEHPHTLTSINDMGLLLEAQGKLEQAEPYFHEALEKSRRVQGEEHRNTLTSINNMGLLLRSQGKLDQAEPYYREALEKRRRVLGEEHPDTINSINNMGFLLRSQGKLDQAEPYYREALEKRRRVLGEEHPGTLISFNNMGSLLQAQGKLEQAEPYFRGALAIRRRALGEEHPDTIYSINNMGGLLMTQGKLDQAEPYFREALEKFRRVLGEEHPNTLAVTGSLGRVLQQQGKHQDAIDLLAPIEPAARKQFTGGNARRLADFLTSLALARMGVGYDAEQFALAEANLLEAHSIYLAATDRGPEHKDTLACVQGLVDLYVAWNEAEPGKGYDAKAAEWNAKLEQAGSDGPDD